ncbi:hypothetical protein AB6A23_16025 [Paenibacillus tarimensis]
MKWRNTLLAAVLLCGLISACSSNENNAVPDQTGTNETDQIQPDIDKTDGSEGQNQDNGNLASDARSPFPPSVYEGKIEGVPYGLGDLTEGMQSELDDPESIQYFAGGLYFSFPDVVYFTDADLDEDGIVIDGTVKKLGFRAGSPLLGVVVGQTFDEISAVLGDGYELRTPEDNVNNEFYENAWSMEYAIGNEYRIVFTAEEKEGPTLAAYFGEQ